jgi:hypothetical protein
MTRGDIIVQILAEVLGTSETPVAQLLESFKLLIPGQHNFDEELTDAAARELLDGLKLEKEGIRAWLLKG